MEPKKLRILEHSEIPTQWNSNFLYNFAIVFSEFLWSSIAFKNNIIFTTSFFRFGGRGNFTYVPPWRHRWDLRALRKIFKRWDQPVESPSILNSTWFFKFIIKFACGKTSRFTNCKNCYFVITFILLTNFWYFCWFLRFSRFSFVTYTQVLNTCAIFFSLQSIMEDL